ncbi:hypothetical protein [Thioalkalivibrio sp.]|uniref:hypothetical protein n=1 Tax=Thioalkalivibrio sp. TaxID=2093813 RepID=UPI0039753675
MRLCALLVMGIWLLSGQYVAAEGLGGGGESLAAEDGTLDGDAEEPTEIRALTATRQALHGSAYWLVENVDSWFGDMPFDEEGGRVRGTVRLRLVYREDDGLATDSRFKLRVKMPNVSTRAYVFIGRDNEQELVSDQSEAFTREQLLLPENESDSQTLFVGLGYLLRDNLDFRLGVRSGYKLYGQARYRKVWSQTEASNLAWRQTIFLAVDDGLGTTTSLDYTYVLSPRTALRWRNSGTFSTETAGVNWSTSLGLFQAFGDARQLSVEILGNGETDARVPMREYGIRGIWSQPVYRDWVIGELILGHFWPKYDDDPQRDRSWAAGLGIEMQF